MSARRREGGAARRGARLEPVGLAGPPRCLSRAVVAVLLVLLSPVGGVAQEPAATTPSGREPLAPVHTATIERIDGRTQSGIWIGVEDDHSVSIATSEATERFPLGSVRSITFVPERTGRSGEPFTAQEPWGAAERLPASDDRPWLVLHDGSCFPIRILASTDGGIRAATPFGRGEAEIPFEVAAAVQWGDPRAFPEAEAAFQTTRRARRLGEDRLVTRSTADVRVVPGRVESLTAEGGEFVFQDRSRPFSSGKMYAVVLALPTVEPAPASIVVHLQDGAILAGEWVSADAATLRLDHPILRDVSVPLSIVSRLMRRSERLVYVTDLAPVNRKTEGRLHEAPPVVFDGGIGGGPLRTGGRMFERGLGLRSFTRLEYDLGGRFESLVLTAGIDDTVRPRGMVDFRIIGDGRILIDSVPLRGSEPPREIRAEVCGVRRLSLIVDYGDEIDLADLVVLGDARLLKPDPAERGKRAAP